MQGFGEINLFLKSYRNELYKIPGFKVEKYIDTMNTIYDIGLKSYQNGFHYFKNVEDIKLPTKKITIDETISVVISYLKTIDFSFVTCFEKAYREGIIHFTYLKDLEQLQYNENNSYRFGSMTGVLNSTPFIHIVLEETIADAFRCVHEFSHYSNSGGKERHSFSYALYTEGYAQLFETNFYDFLLGTKWEEEATIYYQGLLLSFLNRTANYIREYAIFSTFLTYGQIKNQTIYRSCKDSFDIKENMKLYLETIKNITEKLKDPNYYFFEDIPYVIGLPFAQQLKKQFLKDKDLFLEEYANLEDQKREYYYKKYIKKVCFQNLYQIPIKNRRDQ